jgi:sigma-E factor negative regulatory protein RseC
MLIEQARIVAKDSDALWVETLAHSACGDCSAKSGCGTGLLERYLRTTQYLRIQLDSRSLNQYKLGDEIKLGMEESVVVRGSLLIYVIPLIGLLFGSGVGYQWGEPGSIVGGIAGLVLGGILVRWHAWKNRLNRHYNPVVLDESAILARS